MQVEQLVHLLCWPSSEQETLERLLQLSKPEYTGDWALAFLRSLAEPLLGLSEPKHHGDIGIW